MAERAEDPMTMMSRRFRPALMAFFVRRIHNPVEAEDLTQEVLARLIDLPDEQMRHPEAYIFRTAANLLGDRHRRLRVREAYQDDVLGQNEVPADYLDPERMFEARQRLGLVSTALAELPQRCREILILCRIERMPKRDIANSYGISVSGVDKYLFRALAHLTRRLEEDE